jgi:DNA-binding CsgD family transcriptional regulator
MRRGEAELSDAIGLIYEAALYPGGWDNALGRCCQLLDGAASQIWGMDLVSRDCIYQTDFGLPAEYKRDFARYFSRESERSRFHQENPGIEITYDYMLHDERSINRHPCYRFRQEHGFRYFIGADLVRTHDVLILVNLQRGPGQGHVDKKDIETFRVLKSHLSRAFKVGVRLEDLDMRDRSAWEAIESSPVAAITLAVNGRVRRCNRVARAILARGDGLRSEAGLLKARRPIDDRRLQAMIGKAGLDFPAGEGGDMAVGREGSERPYSLTITPIETNGQFEALAGDRYLVLINDPDGAPRGVCDLLQRHYGLTPKQSDLALMLSQGRTLAECALDLGIAEKTARRHLEAIYLKTGLNRQIDLVRLVLSMPGRPLD